jgi:hypothetical protein
VTFVEIITYAAPVAVIVTAFSVVVYRVMVRHRGP